MFEMTSDEDSAILTVPSPPDKSLRLLLVEDSAGDAHVVQLHLKHGLNTACSVERVETLSAAINCLTDERFDLVLLDLNLPDSSGIETFHRVFERADGIPILILSGNEDRELAIAAVRGGAQDYVLKGEIEARALGREVHFAIERSNRVGVEKKLKVAQEQISIARRLQRGLYPHSSPAIAGFDIAGHAWAAEHACGDYFDFLPLRRGAIEVVVGDVSGHGLGPALKMVETRAALHALSKYEEDLSKLIEGVHDVFCGGQDFETRGLFATLFLGRLDPTSRVFQYSSAGHPAYHLTATGDVRMTETMDYPIGLMEEMSGEGTREMALEQNDVVVIPTDGFYEAGVNGQELFGVDRMMSVVRNNRHRSADEIVKAMYEASRDYLGEMPQQDDMAAIVIRVT